MEEYKLTYDNILRTYKEDYNENYFKLFNEAIKEKDFLNIVVQANMKDLFYSVYNPYFFYNKELDIHIYYKYIPKIKDNLKYIICSDNIEYKIENSYTLDNKKRQINVKSLIIL